MSICSSSLSWSSENKVKILLSYPVGIWEVKTSTLPSLCGNFIDGTWHSWLCLWERVRISQVCCSVWWDVFTENAHKAWFAWALYKQAGWQFPCLEMHIYFQWKYFIQKKSPVGLKPMQSLHSQCPSSPSLGSRLHSSAPSPVPALCGCAVKTLQG